MIRLAIVEDNPIYLSALEDYLSTIEDIDLVFDSNSLEDIDLLLSTRPDVVIMDIDLGAASGITGVQIIKKALPEIGVLMLTVFEDEDKIIQSVQAGAIGYLLKKDSPKKIVEAIRSIYNGEGAISGIIAKKMMEGFSRAQPKKPNIESYNLTKRETEILLLLIDGLSYKEIAAKCFISMATLNSHIRNLYEKLDIHTRAEIAAQFRK